MPTTLTSCGRYAIGMIEVVGPLGPGSGVVGIHVWGFSRHMRIRRTSTTPATRVFAHTQRRGGHDDGPRKDFEDAGMWHGGQGDGSGSAHRRPACRQIGQRMPSGKDLGVGIPYGTPEPLSMARNKLGKRCTIPLMVLLTGGNKVVAEGTHASKRSFLGSGARDRGKNWVP